MFKVYKSSFVDLHQTKQGNFVALCSLFRLLRCQSYTLTVMLLLIMGRFKVTLVEYQCESICSFMGPDRPAVMAWWLAHATGNVGVPGSGPSAFGNVNCPNTLGTTEATCSSEAVKIGCFHPKQRSLDRTLLPIIFYAIHIFIGLLLGVPVATRTAELTF